MNKSILAIAILLLALFSTLPIAQGRTPPPPPPPPPPIAPPIAPPPASDASFVHENANSSSSITIHINRVVGQVNNNGTLLYPRELVANEVVSAQTTLTMLVYVSNCQIGSCTLPNGQLGQYTNCNVCEPIYFRHAPRSSPQATSGALRFTFNGTEFTPTRDEVVGADSTGTWREVEIEVPTELVRFGKEMPDGAEPTAGENQVGTVNTNQLAGVRWAAVRVKAISPIILIHGNNSSGEFFVRQGFTNYLNEKRIPYDNTIELAPDTIAKNGGLLNDKIREIVKKFGVKNVHLVCHSKGGLDAREYLAKHQPNNSRDFKIISYTSLSTPHNGSIGADVLEARREGFDVEFAGFPEYAPELATLQVILETIVGRDKARPDLTTNAAARFNAANVPALPRNIIYTALAADADKNGNYRIDLEAEYEALLKESGALRGFHAISPERARGIVDVTYQLIHQTKSISVRTREERTLLGFKRTVYIIQSNHYNSHATSPERRNDTLVTIRSGLGYNSFGRVTTNQVTYNTPEDARNHANIADAGVADKVLYYIRQAESNRR